MKADIHNCCSWSFSYLLAGCRRSSLWCNCRHSCRLMLISTISMIGEDFSLEHWQNLQTVTVSVKALRPFRSLTRLRQCCRCAIAMLVQVLVVWQTCERHETFIFLHALVHTRPFLDRDWGRSCWPQQRLWFLILIPHAVVKKQWAADSHNLLSEKVIDDLAAAVFKRLSGTNACAYTAGLAPAWNGNTSLSWQNLLSLVRLEIVAELFLWMLVQSLWSEMKPWTRSEVEILDISILTIVLLILCQLASDPPFYK